MKYLASYRNIGISEEKVFDYFMSSLKDSIITWGYFTDFEKVKDNIRPIEVELAILNTLIGKENLEQEFIEILKEYPKVRLALPILIALRKAHLKKLNVICNLESFETRNMVKLFDPTHPLTKEVERELVVFLKDSGLKAFLGDKHLKNIVDYCYGVEVGLDSNGRKNRTGTIMEGLVGNLLQKQFGASSDYTIATQASASSIKEIFGITVNFGRNEKGKERRVDFALFKKSSGTIYAIETNAYMGGGSKLKATAGEYETLSRIISQQKNVSFVWITDGPGWHTTKEPLREAFQKLDYIFNLKMIEDGILRSVVG